METLSGFQGAFFSNLFRGFLFGDLKDSNSILIKTVGTGLVRGWYGVGTGLARGWYGVGTGLVRGWYAVGTVELAEMG